MAIKRLNLSGSQHQAWDRLSDERAMQMAKLDAQEKRFLFDCLLELGGRPNEPWQFEPLTRTFWINIPDDNAPTAHEGTTAEDRPPVAL